MEYCHSIALHHHERYDGRGYPDGLVGDETPIGVQCVGLADVYDAIVSVRCYKEGMSHDEAVELILSGQSGAFNPRLLESFRACKDRMHALYLSEEEDFERNVADQQVS
jgi:putative two-component system response regulator